MELSIDSTNRIRIDVHGVLTPKSVLIHDVDMRGRKAEREIVIGNITITMFGCDPAPEDGTNTSRPNPEARGIMDYEIDKVAFESKQPDRGYEEAEQVDREEKEMNIPGILKPENVLRLIEIGNEMYLLNMKDRWEPEDKKKYIELGAEREKLRRGE